MSNVVHAIKGEKTLCGRELLDNSGFIVSYFPDQVTCKHCLRMLKYTAESIVHYTHGHLYGTVHTGCSLEREAGELEVTKHIKRVTCKNCIKEYNATYKPPKIDHNRMFREDDLEDVKYFRGP